MTQSRGRDYPCPHEETGLFIVRLAVEKDMPQILEIERDAISPPWSHGALLAEIYRDDSLFALAVESGVVIGFCILRRMTDEGELLQIAVDKPYRRRGAADALMQAALAWAAEHGLGSVFLEVRASGIAPIALYEKYGFRPASRRKGYYTHPTEDALIMRLCRDGASIPVS